MSLQRFVRNMLRSRGQPIDPDEIFIDASNLPEFDTHQFEGRIEHPIGKFAVYSILIGFLALAAVFAVRLWDLQVGRGEVYAAQSENNRLRQQVVFADRGVIYDRDGTELVWNSPLENEVFARRSYYEETGFAHLLGYVSYPQKDDKGFFFQEVYEGKDGIEKVYNDALTGHNGLALIETNALGDIQSQSVVLSSRHGERVNLSVDAELQAKLFEIITRTAEDVGFSGGTGVIMDVNSGEIIALTSYPEFDSGVLSDADDRERIEAYIADTQNPFLNRVVSGLYTPGSIVKPFVSVGVLEEGIIDPEKKIISTGSIRVPNPYVPGAFSEFTDWKAHGAVNLKEALAVSSNVYFYHVGGGFADQQGIGIANIGKYMELFGFGDEVGISLSEEGVGTIPSPEWKEATFDGEPWRIGDTYNTTIGQYGFQVTPIQVVRAVGALANGGVLRTPTLIAGEVGSSEVIPVEDEHLRIVRDGMRLAVTDGTANGLNTSYVSVAAKTGTAELGTTKDFVNAWAIGFFPYENPQYAFAVMMERGPQDNLIGGISVMRQLLDWMRDNAPEYFEV